MANKYQVWGEARIRINGANIDHGGKATLVIGGTKRDAVSADHKAGFFTNMTEESTLEFDALVTPDVSLSEIQGWEDVTISVEFDTGQSYVINHGRTADIVSANDGKAKVKMAGPPAEEIRA